MAKRPEIKAAGPATPRLYTVLEPILHDGEAYGPGDLIELTEEDAAPLLRGQCLAGAPDAE